MPESVEQLVAAVRCCSENDCPFFVMGNGSNVVFPDEGYDGVVLKTLRMNGVEFRGGTLVRVEAGALNQLLIQKCLAEGLGGIEYLYSVPGTVGGAVFMNAGRGWWHFLSIGQRVVSVEIWDGHRRRTLSKKECRFGYRTSVFQEHPEWIILLVTLRLKRVRREKGKRSLKERMQHVERAQDRAFPNVGSVFRSGFKRHVLSDPQRRFGGIALSAKTNNWMLNLGNGTARDARELVEWIRSEHRKAGRKEPELEVRFVDPPGV